MLVFRRDSDTSRYKTSDPGSAYAFSHVVVMWCSSHTLVDAAESVLPRVYHCIVLSEIAGSTEQLIARAQSTPPAQVQFADHFLRLRV